MLAVPGWGERCGLHDARLDSGNQRRHPTRTLVLIGKLVSATTETASDGAGRGMGTAAPVGHRHRTRTRDVEATREKSQCRVPTGWRRIVTERLDGECPPGDFQTGNGGSAPTIARRGSQSGSIQPRRDFGCLDGRTVM